MRLVRLSLARQAESWERADHIGESGLVLTPLLAHLRRYPVGRH